MGAERMFRWLRKLFATAGQSLESPFASTVVQNTGVPPPVQDWERELVRRAVERRFTEGHRGAVLAELARMRAQWCAARGSAQPNADELVRLVVRTQLDVIEESGGDPAFFTEEHYEQSAGGMTDRDRLCFLDGIIKDLQLRARDVAALVKMLDTGTTRLDALTALAGKGTEAAPAIPRLVELLKESDQLECCKVLRTLAGIGPAGQGAVSAVIELANDPDYLIRRQARATLTAIAPERAAELGLDK
jgi:hypothetical protein